MDDKTNVLAKLEQLEDQARHMLGELQAGLQKSRVQHIIALTRTVRAKIEAWEVPALGSGRGAASDPDYFSGK